ncbi:MAG: RluA family pseudouridine synthase, partial [Opitutales bacterium]|nr:RluA family pseudouridine synthase [Opitutales bacterium]
MLPNERAMENEENSGEKPLLDWAMLLCPDSPRKRIKEWIVAGRFYLDGEPVTQAGLRLTDPGERLSFGKPDSAVSAWAHRKRIHSKLTLLYLDESLAIVDKAAGVLSVPAEGSARDASALEILADHLNDPEGNALRKQIFGNQTVIQPLPVHRLDQYTSGLFCIAMNLEARRNLIEQLRAHELIREYLAFVDGIPNPSEGTWKHHLEMDERGYQQQLRPKPGPNTSEVVTHYRVEHSYPRKRVTQLRLRLETGLKHQIRIQAAAEGLALIGDRSYHGATLQLLARGKSKLPFHLNRQALHAAALRLRHPKNGTELHFESPLPRDLADLEKRLS